MNDSKKKSDVKIIPRKETLKNRKLAVHMQLHILPTVQDIVTIMQFMELVKNDKPIPTELVLKFTEINESTKILNLLRKDYISKIKTPSQEIIDEIFQRFNDPKFDNAIKPEYKKLFGDYYFKKNIALIIYKVAKKLINLKPPESKIDFYYYQQSFLSLTSLISKYYKDFYKGEFSTYKRAALATHIVIMLGLVSPTKFKEKNTKEYSNKQLVDISKRALEKKKIATEPRDKQR